MAAAHVPKSGCAIIIAAVLNMINTTMTICTRFFSAISENVAANPVFFAILKVTTASALSDLDKIKLKRKRAASLLSVLNMRQTAEKSSRFPQ